jgi:hypothetical protein
MPIRKASRRKPGRPRKYGQGRVNATVRFTPERYAALRAEADQHGRSLSEQVEHIVENAARDRELIADLRRQTEIQGKLTAEQMDKLRAAHATELIRWEDKRMAETVEAAVMRALRKAPR